MAKMKIEYFPQQQRTRQECLLHHILLEVVGQYQRHKYKMQRKGRKQEDRKRNNDLKGRNKIVSIIIS